MVKNENRFSNKTFYYYYHYYFYAITRIPYELQIGERSGIVVEYQTPNGEVLGLIPTGGTVLCL